MGAILADSILQAGLSYKNVVLPRVRMILRVHTEMDCTSALLDLVKDRKVASFLNWNHEQKISRFERLVLFLSNQGVEHVNQLRDKLTCKDFCAELQSLNGIGPKTVDYMACLVGIDSIAVDRHIRSFAKQAGVENQDYDFLHLAFCCAADLLNLPRREFDAWVWRNEAETAQLSLSL